MKTIQRFSFTNLKKGACLCALILLAASIHAYNFDGNNLAANSGRPRWASSPVTYQFNNNVNASLPNVGGVSPRPGINAAFAEWDSECAVSFTLGADSAVQDGTLNDGINLITFANVPNNVSAVGGALAVCLYWRDGSNNITDAGIIYHLAPTNFSPAAGHFDVQSLTTHEAGHFIGLEHSAICAATMWPYLGQNGVITESELTPSTATHDDRAGANQLYPQAPYVLGAGGIQGSVTLGGANVYGSHVVAIRMNDGITYAANLTLGSNQGANHGRYSIQGLPPGNYRVYAEPMDQPSTSGNWTGNFAGGDHWGSTFTSGYLTTYYGGNSTPATVVVTAGTTQTANIAVTAGTPTINPQFFAFSPTGFGFTSSAGLPLRFQPGTTRYVVIIGDGISAVPNAGITCPDPTITINTSARQNGPTGPYTYSIFQVTVPGGAIGGPRNIQLQNGSEIAVYTGGIDVNAADVWPTPANATRDGQLLE